MNKSSIFSTAHKYAKENRNLFTSYKKAFSQGLKISYKANKYPSADEIADLVKRENGAIGMEVRGGMIYGCYRGKGSEDFKFSVTERAFIYNNANYAVKKAFRAVLGNNID